MRTVSPVAELPAAGAGRGRGAVLAALLGLLGLFGFLYASQIYVGTRAEGMDHSFWRMLAWQWAGWGSWALLTPPILWLGGRVPFERASWWRALPVHLAACVALSALHLAFFTFITDQIRPYDVMTVERAFTQSYVGRMRGQLHIDLLIYGIILGVGHAFGYYRRFRERAWRAAQLESQLAQAQLQALKMQLHPHFLFNTLNGVAALVRDNRNKEAVTMLAGLSDLLRHTLDSAGRQEVPLREELDFLELYLDIQQMRFPDRLRVELRVAPDTLDALVPNLILQPLVENAVRHGVAPRAAAGTVGVAAEREDGLLWVTVYDDGPGLKGGRPAPTEGGIGLPNTRARLEQLYGARHRFGVRNREGGGVEAVMAIPFRREEGEGRG
ncbi:MAG TPA: histidine kinase [Pyrinomonadaceae bacterium]|nr:histidine kinase [Pyrinomonadaceae bacterium]